LAVRKTKPAFLEPFLYNNDHFTKPGSGQTWKKLREKGKRFLQEDRSPMVPATSGAYGAAVPCCRWMETRLNTGSGTVAQANRYRKQVRKR
jgi:hypothetical protein